MTPDASADTWKKLLRARVHLLADRPFFGTLLTRLRPQPREDLERGTLALDGDTLWYDPVFVRDADLELLKLGLLNVVGHLALLHGPRQGSRDDARWAVACEYAVNAMIKDHRPQDAPALALPDDWLYDPAHAETSAEEIYGRLKGMPIAELAGLEDRVFADASCRRSDGDTSRGDGRCGDPCRPWTQEGDKWRRRVQNTAWRLREHGEMPGDLQETLGLDGPNELDWRSLLRNFILENVRHDYSWLPPNRRYLRRGILLPRLDGEGGTVAVVVDTSGSMQGDQVEACFDEVRSCMEAVPGMEVLLVQCDAEVQDSRQVQHPDELETVDVQGFGGTDFQPAFRHIEQREDRDGLDVQVVVYLTDLHGTFPAREPGWPVLWVATSDEEVPFGRRVRLDSRR